MPVQEDREQGTPQGKLLDEEPSSGGESHDPAEPEQEGGPDSVGDATGEGG